MTKEEQPAYFTETISEFTAAEDELRNIRPAVSIFGSARISSDSPVYQQCVTLAQKLSDTGFNIISGGGPGIMEAANKGAKAGVSRSVGLNIELPHEQFANPYQDISLNFKHFFSRKYMFIRHSIAFVAMPGGFGTLDEVSEVLTLIQTQKMPPAPIILFGEQFWTGLKQWLENSMLPEKLISAGDTDLLQVVDNIDEILQIVCHHYDKISQTNDPQCECGKWRI
ncbi:MAG: TIGR00730 family Rossman fold protein [Neisseriaceae bacterium]|nr:TIGR00730 family Rossman fold protein [Neisseriaceae bacterium]